jgi:hypothetical protein
MPILLNRRSMLLSAASLPALAVGSSLLGHSRAAFAALPKGSSWGPAGKLPKANLAALDGPLRPLAERVLQKTRHAFTVAAANPKASFAKGGMAASAAKFLNAQSKGRWTRASSRAQMRLSSPDAEWKAAFGSYGKVEASEYGKALSPGDTYLVAVEKMATDMRTYAGKVRRKPKMTKQEEPKIKKEKETPKVKKEKPGYGRIEFHLNRVHCVEDTNEVDSDEIFIGGYLIRSDEQVSTIAKHKVGDDFDTGEARYYDHSRCAGEPAGKVALYEQQGYCAGSTSDPWAGRVLASAPLDGPWPGTFGLVMLMFEQDYGGMNQVLTELYGRIKDDLREAIDDLGESVGDAVAEYLGEDIGAIVHEIVVWVLSNIVQWIASLFDTVDDPIDGDSWIVQLPNRTRESIDALASGGVDTPSGSCGSKITQLAFHGDGGRYKADLHWRAIA